MPACYLHLTLLAQVVVIVFNLLVFVGVTSNMTTGLTCVTETGEAAT